MRDAEIVQAEARIGAMESERDAMPQGGEGGDTPRNRKTLEIFALKEQLQAARQPARPEPRSAADIVATVKQRQDIAATRQALQGELDAAPQGNEAATHAIADLEGLAEAERLARRVEAQDAMGFAWSDFDRMKEGWTGDTEPDWHRTIYQGLGFTPYEAIRMASAWATDRRAVDEDFRQRWAGFTEKDAAFARFASMLPASLHARFDFK